jgi:hypothetical protein
MADGARLVVIVEINRRRFNEDALNAFKGICVKPDLYKS